MKQAEEWLVWGGTTASTESLTKKKGKEDGSLYGR